MKNSDLYLKIVEWSEEDQCYVGTCPGLFYGGCHGDNEAEVYKELCKVVDENIDIKMYGWHYDKNLTEYFKKVIEKYSPVDPIPCNWSVHIKSDRIDYNSNRNIRIYARPDVPISQWSLIFEAYLDEDGNIILS